MFFGYNKIERGKEHLKLDNYQIKAVNAKERNILVVAAPGSGKTTVIINRIKHFIEDLLIKEENIISDDCSYISTVCGSETDAIFYIRLSVQCISGSRDKKSSGCQ